MDEKVRAAFLRLVPVMAKAARDMAVAAESAERAAAACAKHMQEIDRRTTNSRRRP